MKERPILFSGPMVRAILDGRKTQTRRVVKDVAPRQQIDFVHGEFLAHGHGPGWAKHNGGSIPVECPYGQPGDRLWVRETFGWFSTATGACLMYRAEMSKEIADKAGPWKPSIHMPRWASRILLEITDVRVERLQDITEAEALAEGVTTRKAFRQLWASIHKPDSWPEGWDANPWVWVVTFKKLENV